MSRVLLVFLIITASVPLAGCVDGRLDAGEVRADIDRAQGVVQSADESIAALIPAINDLRNALDAANASGDSEIAARVSGELGRAQEALDRREELRELALASIARSSAALAEIDARGDNGLGESLETAGVLAQNAAPVAGELGGAPLAAGVTILGSVLVNAGQLFSRMRRGRQAKDKERQFEEVVTAFEKSKDESGRIDLGDGSVAQRIRSDLSLDTRAEIRRVRRTAA